jgi:hypothetical protein
MVARAYSHFLSLANAAEQKHKARSPDSALFPDAAPGQQRVLVESSIKDVLARGHSKDQVFEQVRGVGGARGVDAKCLTRTSPLQCMPLQCVLLRCTPRGSWCPAWAQPR